MSLLTVMVSNRSWDCKKVIKGKEIHSFFFNYLFFLAYKGKKCDLGKKLLSNIKQSNFHTVHIKMYVNIKYSESTVHSYMQTV